VGGAADGRAARGSFTRAALPRDRFGALRRILATALALSPLLVPAATAREATTVAKVALPAALQLGSTAALPPAGWQPGMQSARRWAARRQGDVSFAVRTEERAWSWRGATRMRSASVVKAMLLVAYLRRGDVRARSLSASERALLDPMVRRSDNDAADAISARVGVPRLTALGRKVGMTEFAPYAIWGGSGITASDQARFFVRVDRLVPPRHRRYAMRLLRGIVPEQRWGLARAVPDGWRVAFKGGWGALGTREVNHQAGLFTRGEERVAVAVLTADNPSDAYGQETLRGVARRLLRGLAKLPAAPPAAASG